MARNITEWTPARRLAHGAKMSQVMKDIWKRKREKERPVEIPANETPEERRKRLKREYMKRRYHRNRSRRKEERPIVHESVETVTIQTQVQHKILIVKSKGELVGILLFGPDGKQIVTELTEVEI